MASRSLNSIPFLAAEDKRGTENFKKYVTEIMDINWDLLPILVKLAINNRRAASDLTARIEKKEIRALADFAVGVVPLDELALEPSRQGW